MTVVELVVVDRIEGVGEVAESIFRLLLHHHVGDFGRLSNGHIADQLIVEVAEGIVEDILAENCENSVKCEKKSFLNLKKSIEIQYSFA